MADNDAGVPGPTDMQTPHDEEPLASGDDLATQEDRPTQVAVVKVGGSPAVQWRRRALAVRAAVPQLARNPVVVGASAMVASVALRAAADVAWRAIGSSGSSQPRSVTVTGSILHEVHVVRHVHVVHHVVHHYPHGVLPSSSPWPPSRP